MCFVSSPPRDNSAEIARQREEARQARIAEGRSRIDDIFGQYNEPYFSDVNQTYLDYYLPEVDDQYQNAYKRMVFGLSRGGNLSSGTGADQLRDLKERYNDQRQYYTSRAGDLTQAFRGNIENARSDLYAQNRSAADPSTAAAEAARYADQFRAAPTPGPLGALFADVLSNAATGVAAERGGYPGLKTGLFKPKSSSVSYVQ